MRNIRTLACVIFMLSVNSFILYSQDKPKVQRIDPESLGIPRRVIRERDMNEMREINTDLEFNTSRRGVLLDGQFIKSDIGIDLYETEGEGHSKRPNAPFWIKRIGVSNDSIFVDKPQPDTIRIHNLQLMDLYEYHYNKENVKLVTLDEVRQEFFPETKGKCVYMINKFFITRDMDLYKLDRDFILKVEKLESTDIETLKELPSFSVIRIFTKTVHNWHWEGRL